MPTGVGWLLVVTHVLGSDQQVQKMSPCTSFVGIWEDLIRIFCPSTHLVVFLFGEGFSYQLLYNKSPQNLVA